LISRRFHGVFLEVLYVSMCAACSRATSFMQTSLMRTGYLTVLEHARMPGSDGEWMRNTRHIDLYPGLQGNTTPADSPALAGSMDHVKLSWWKQEL
jgi:hypothetical protein